MRDHALLALVLELAELLRRQVKVLEALLRTRGVDPCDVKLVDELLGDTETSARVGGEVDTREAELASDLGHGKEVAVLVRSERTDLEGDVVRDDDDATTLRALRGVDRVDPADHANFVGAGRPRDLLRRAKLVEDELLGDERLCRRGLASELPLTTDRLAE